MTKTIIPSKPDILFESDDESDDQPEIFQFDDSNTAAPVVSKREKRRFMGEMAPKLGQDESKAATVDLKDKTAQEDMKNDLDLQRLINESDILAQHQTYSGADISLDFDPIGKARLKALDSRLAALGAPATTSSTSQRNMPMNMRKGIAAKRKADQQKFQTYAKEAGIVLARTKKKKGTKSRQYGLKIAAVGRNTPHGLKISEAEIARVSKKRRP